MNKTEKYKNNPDIEDTLGLINLVLWDAEEETIQGYSSPEKSVVFIVGAPRSGTTLLHQLLASTGAFGYITNYIARFWNAPYIAALQQEVFGFGKYAQKMILHSDLGRTNGLHQPHHFSRFWRRWFGWDENHQMKQVQDKSFLQGEVAALEQLYNKPMLFRSDYCGMQIPFLRKTFKKPRFIICARNMAYQAQSILRARKAMFGSYDEWFSLKPKEYNDLKELNPYQQVIGQIHYIMHQIYADLGAMDLNDFILVSLENLWRYPKEEIARIFRSLLPDTPLPRLNHIPKELENKNKKLLPPEEWNKIISAKEKMKKRGYTLD